MKNKTPLILVIIIFFMTSLLTAYIAIILLPYSYYPERVYSTPTNEGNYNNSTQGGEASYSSFPLMSFIGPRPGATNVSLDTVIYVYQTRPVKVEIQLDPETTFAKIEDKEDPPASRNTIFYPAQLLQPSTTYNVSGSIMNLPAWWTFTTTSESSQVEYDSMLSPYAWWIAVLAAFITTTIFTVIIWKSYLTNIISQSDSI